MGELTVVLLTRCFSSHLPSPGLQSFCSDLQRSTYSPRSSPTPTTISLAICFYSSRNSSVRSSLFSRGVLFENVKPRLIPHKTNNNMITRVLLPLLQCTSQKRSRQVIDTCRTRTHLRAGKLDEAVAKRQVAMRSRSEDIEVLPPTQQQPGQHNVAAGCDPMQSA